MDVLDFFRGVHAWSKLYRLIDRLPRESRYKAALAMDDRYAQEAARRMRDADVDDEPEMTPLGYSRQVELLSALVTSIWQLRATLIAVNQGKPPQVEPLPRPVTALEKAIRALDFGELNELASLVRPE